MNKFILGILATMLAGCDKQQVIVWDGMDLIALGILAVICVVIIGLALFGYLRQEWMNRQQHLNQGKERKKDIE